MKIAKVRDVKTPVRGTSKSAGIDFFVPNDFFEATVTPGMDILIPSGIVANIPENYMLLEADKSGVATSRAAMLAAGKTAKPGSFDSNIIVGAKIIDEDYQGEIGLHLINVGKQPIVIKSGMKIVQFILVPVSYEGVDVVDLKDLFSEVSERGEGGFNSLGRY